MENIELIISLATTAASLLALCVGFVAKLIKSVKGKIKAISELKLFNALMPLVEIVEEFTDYSGEEKKQYVLEKAYKFALENDLPFDAEAVSDRIEQLVDLTLNVNKRVSG